MKIGQNSPESQETGFLPKIPCFCGATVDGSKKSQLEPVDRLVFFYPNDFTGFWDTSKRWLFGIYQPSTVSLV